jgi:two-component system sensor histidine kinase KdpD
VVWETTERIMVAVSGAPGTDVLLRRAARIALRVKGELDVVHVTVSDATLPEEARPVDRLQELAADLGASWHEIEDDDPAEAIISFAREHQITQIVTGSIQSSWWHIPGGGPILRRVIHDAGAYGIDVHLIARREPPPGAAPSPSAAQRQPLP